ncbi:MAG: response regulator [Pseudomonadota bacterium]
MRSLVGLTILIVEDEVFIAQSLRSNLIDAGASAVKTAGALKDAIAQIATTQFDLVILDIRLPDGESYDLASTLVSRSIPVVVHSGHATSAHDERLTEVVFCAKPASPAELLQVIEAALDR